MVFAIPPIVMLFIIAIVMNSTIILGMTIGFLMGSAFTCYMFRYIIKTRGWSRFIGKAIEKETKRDFSVQGNRKR